MGHAMESSFPIVIMIYLGENDFSNSKRVNLVIRIKNDFCQSSTLVWASWRCFQDKFGKISPKINQTPKEANWEISKIITVI